MRRCSPCGQMKPLSEFNKDSSEYGGYRYYCKACAKVKKSNYLQRKKQEMNQSKFEQSHRGLSAIAKKVFDSVPKTEAWNAPAISAEMRRLGSGGADSRVVLGCLNTLIESGLVKEIKKGEFQRVEIREKSESTFNKPKEIEQMKVSVYEIPAKATPIDRLSALAKRLRDLATDMDDAAIELAEQAQKNELETEKMRQLQALLKSLG